MILGYEKPVEIAPMSIYDNDLFKTYIGALKDDYDKTLAEQKEFAKTIGDFYSPSSVDNQAWYDMTMGPIQRFLEQNPDAARSIQGRAALRQLINSRPYGDMAKLQAGADALKARQKAEQQMIASGKKLLPDNVDVSNWDTLHNGVLTATAPTELQSLNQYTSYLFDNLKDSDLGPSPRNKMYRMSGVTEAQMRPIVDYSMDDLLQGTLGQFYYNSAKQDLIREGNIDPTDAQIREKFADNVIAANSERIHVKDELDEIEKMNYEHRLRVRLQQQKASDAERLARLKAQLKDQENNDPSNPYGRAYNYEYANTVDNLMSVYGKSGASKIHKYLMKGDPRALKLYQADRLKKNDGKAGSVFNQSILLAGKEDNNGFYARVGKEDAITATRTNKDEGKSTTTRKQNIGIDINKDVTETRKLHTLGDISVLAYGHRRIKNNRVSKTSNGNSTAVAKKIRGAGVSVNTPLNETIQRIRPVSGDRNIIYQMNNDGTYHAYRKVNVVLDNNKQVNGLWYDYGQVDLEGSANQATSIRYKKYLGINDTAKSGVTLDDSPDFDTND